MPNYDYVCETCESVTVENFRMAERPEEITCACGGRAPRVFAMPNLMIKEAYPDGIKRKGWAEMKESSKLNKQIALQKDDKEKTRIANEIRKMGVQIRK